MKSPSNSPAYVAAGGSRGNLGVVAALFLSLVMLSGCSSGNSTTVVNYPVPANVVLSPATSASVDVGATLTFSAQAQDNKNSAVTQPITYFSSNPAVATVAANGIACAGTWDSISSPQVCTAGPAGVAQITASAQGVSSPPTTLYAHQHIDSITVSPVPSQTNPTTPCVSKGRTFEYAARAFSRGSDITATVGQFGWSTSNSAVVTLTTTNSATPLFQNQMVATAVSPGVSSTFATIGGVISVPFDFITCPVQSIVLSVNGTAGNLSTLAQGSSQTLTATVTDSLNHVITGVPLTWVSSKPSSVSVAGVTANGTGTVSASSAGGASVIATCTPPNCNIGFQPSLPIYPQVAAGFAVTPTGSTTGSGTLYVTSSGCQAVTGCISTVAPVAVPANTVGTAVNLPATPDSMAFSPAGGVAFLGTDSGELGSKGLMRLTVSSTSPAVTQNTAVAGKVAAISPDGSRVIVSDIVDPNSPPQVFVFDTVGGVATAIPLASGTLGVAAAFSPDSLKAFIVASNGSAGTLYVYSKVDALQTIVLGSAAKDVAFLPSGNFGYVADALPQLSIVPTCDNPPAGNPPQVTSTPAAVPPSFIRPVIDGRMLTVESPGIELFTPAIIGNGCAFPRPYPVTADLNPNNLVIPGDLSVTNTSAFFNLGQGSFIPRQLIVSADGSTAYVLASDSNNNPLGIILTFNIPNHTSSAIGLSGNAIPLQAALTLDGTVLYVGASDGTVHAVSTVAGGDFQQIAFPLGLCRNSAGTQFAITCNPDLVAITP